MNVRKLMLASVATASVVLTSSVLADNCATTTHPWYAGVLGGVSWTKDFSGSANAVDVNANFNTGSVWGVQVGHNFNPNWTAEAQYLYFHSPVNKVKVSGTEQAGSRGNLTTQALMLNGFYNFVGLNAKVTPYVGVGAGMANVKANGRTDSDSAVVNSSDNVFAYQAIVGAKYSLNDAWSLGLDYRYFRTATADLKYTSSDHNFSDRFTSQTVALSLEYSFA